MSKNALVISGADFSANKLTTVSFGEDVPCTGLSLSESSITATNLTPITITATKTPENTTDVLSWASSDSTVAAVDGGTVTIKGLGTATITATCGTQTATCTISATEITPNLDFGHFQLGAYETTFLRSSDSDSRFAVYDKNTSGAIPRGFRVGNDHTGAPIPLINNVGRIHFEATSIYSGYNVAIFWCDTDTPASADPEWNHCAMIRFADDTAETYTGTSVSEDYAVPTDKGTINAVAIMIRKKATDAGTSVDPDQFATDHGITLKFLPAETI